MQVKKRLVFFFILLLAVSLWRVSSPQTPTHAESNGLVPTPFMGWSTWSYVGKNPTEANVEAQARAEASKLKAYGYNYVLLDDWYYLNPATTVDQYGRWVIDFLQVPAWHCGCCKLRPQPRSEVWFLSHPWYSSGGGQQEYAN